MQQISRIEKLTSGRYRVTLEDETSFPLYGKELAAYGIEEGADLAQEVYEEIMTELLPKRAKQRALYLLQSMDRTEHQLRQKLELCEYPPEIVDEAVEYVRSYHYIDDLRYARTYIEYHKESRSRKRLEQDLYQKGISREDVQLALEEAEGPDEESQIAAWVEKRKFQPESANRKETDRFFQFLLRKGYSTAAIWRVLR